ncbi:MAG: HEAT repeat domain-containing protein [bacterium]
MSDKEAEDLKEKLNTLEENPFGVHFDPIETLKECLYHRNNEIRVRSARIAGSFPNADFIDPLFRIVAESTELDVRMAALESLGAYLHHGRMSDYHRVEDAEWELEDDDEMSELTTEQFDAIREFMNKLVQQDDWPDTLRGEALAHLARLDPESAAVEIDRFYRSNDEALKLGALKAIARIPSGDWEKLILQELSRQTEDDRILHAIEAAGTHRIVDAGPKLVNIIEESNNPEMREAAAEALSHIPWADSGEQLQRFTEDRNPKVRQFAQEGLIRQFSELDEDELRDFGPDSPQGPGPQQRR